MEIAVIEKIKRLPKQTEESLRDAFSVLTGVEDRKSVMNAGRFSKSVGVCYSINWNLLFPMAYNMAIYTLVKINNIVTMFFK